MECEALLPCDRVIIGTNGKFTIQGAFDCLFAKGFPHIKPQLTIAIRIRAQKSDSGIHPFTLKIVDGNGHSLASVSDQFNVSITDAGDAMAADVYAVAKNVSFPSADRYQIDLLVGGQVLSSVPLYVRLHL